MSTNGYIDAPERQCFGKFKFATKKRAKLHLRRARTFAGRGDMMAYLCPHCDYYHLGTKPGVKAKRRRAESDQMRYTERNDATATGGGEGEDST